MGQSGVLGVCLVSSRTLSFTSLELPLSGFLHPLLSFFPPCLLSTKILPQELTLLARDELSVPKKATDTTFCSSSSRKRRYLYRCLFVPTDDNALFLHQDDPGPFWAKAPTISD